MRHPLLGEKVKHTIHTTLSRKKNHTFLGKYLHDFTVSTYISPFVLSLEKIAPENHFFSLSQWLVFLVGFWVKVERESMITKKEQKVKRVVLVVINLSK